MTMKRGLNAFLGTFEIGERRYVETTPETFIQSMRNVSTGLSGKRRPAQMEGWKFATKLFTAVPASNVGDIRYLICIEREQ